MVTLKRIGHVVSIRIDRVDCTKSDRVAHLHDLRENRPCRLYDRSRGNRLRRSCCRRARRLCESCSCGLNENRPWRLHQQPQVSVIDIRTDRITLSEIDRVVCWGRPGNRPDLPWKEEWVVCDLGVGKSQLLCKWQAKGRGRVRGAEG